MWTCGGVGKSMAEDYRHRAAAEEVGMALN